MKEFKSFYKTVGGNEGGKCHYPTRLDTYGCGCGNDCNYCVSPDTLILMLNGTQKKISDVKVGDKVYGVKFDGKHYKYVEAIVENKWNVTKEAYKITLENGTELICSGDHRWLSNRGWKYTTGEMCGENQRPYLTNKNYLLGYEFWNSEALERTEDYMKGYLSGMIRGDGNLDVYDYSGVRKKCDIQYHFRLALAEEDGVKRTEEFLNYFGVDTNRFTFSMIDRATGNAIDRLAIRTNKEGNFYKIKELIQEIDSREFRRGFLAGIYDAEGCEYIGAKRIYNTNDDIIRIAEIALDENGFKHTRDKEKKMPSGKILKTVRILGGLPEFLRFRQMTDLAISVNFSIVGEAIHQKNGNHRRIVSIEPIGEKELVDITTSTSNFIANGIVSHNCYAKSLLDFRKMWNPESPAVADIKKIENVIKKIPKGSIVRLGGMTDCFQPIEKIYQVTYRTIRLLNKYGIGYLIVTKCDLVADDMYMEIMDKDLTHIQVTVTTLDDDFYLEKKYEKAPIPSKRIEAIKKLQDAGFDVAIRLSPLIEEYMDFDKLNSLGINKAIVEFLRVNHWIEKWFDCDFSKHTLKEGGYNHLPLEEKKRILDKVHIPNVSVCEDVTEHYEYWEGNYNPNPEDCCNLRFSANKGEKQNE